MIIHVIGDIWQPDVGVCAQSYTLDEMEVRMYVADDQGNVTRDSVANYLDAHAGDFSGITDFQAVTPNGAELIPWADEESEMTYNECMGPLLL
jgi:hypothetical protein